MADCPACRGRQQRPHTCGLSASSAACRDAWRERPALGCQASIPLEDTREQAHLPDDRVAPVSAGELVPASGGDGVEASQSLQLFSAAAFANNAVVRYSSRWCMQCKVATGMPADKCGRCGAPFEVAGADRSSVARNARRLENLGAALTEREGCNICRVESRCKIRRQLRFHFLLRTRAALTGWEGQYTI